jgi:hypothetical protein
MVAGPNGLVLKIFSNTGQIQNMFQIWAKNKKNPGCQPEDST